MKLLLGSFITRQNALVKGVRSVRHAIPAWLVALVILAIVIPAPACPELVNMKKGSTLVEEVIKPVPVPVSLPKFAASENLRPTHIFLALVIQELDTPNQPFEDSHSLYSSDLSPPAAA